MNQAGILTQGNVLGAMQVVLDLPVRALEIQETFGIVQTALKCRGLEYLRII